MGCFVYFWMFFFFRNSEEEKGAACGRVVGGREIALKASSRDVFQRVVASA